MNHKNTYLYKGMKSLLALMSLALIFLMGSCNKDFPNQLSQEHKNDTAAVSSKNRKVLYLIIDGARGRAIRELNAPNLTQIIKRSIYSYDGLSDFNKTSMSNADGWSTMLTGVTAAKHGVRSEDFSGNRLTQYPTLFSRMKALNPTLRSASFSASAAFASNLATDATESKSFNNDDVAVKTALMQELNRDDATLAVAEFGSVEAAGKEFGYSENTPGYATALLKMDAYVGEILEALTKRKNYAGENWLVVIASNKGGALPAGPPTTDKTVYADDSRNNFIAFYNPRFITSLVAKPASDQIPFTSVAPKFYGGDGQNVKAVIPNDNGLYNFGTNDFTIQCKFKGSGTDRSWPVFLSKSTGINNGSTPGWVIYLSGKVWSMNVSGNGGWSNFSSNGVVNDGLWHTITVVFYTEGAKKMVRCLTDGVVTNAGVDITSRGTRDTSVPLAMGRKSGDAENPDVLISELQIFNTALSNATIAAQVKKTTLDPAHPNINNLVGYWPCNEGKGNQLINLAPRGKGIDFTLTGLYQWQVFSEYSPFLDPPISDSFYLLVPNSVDIPFMIYQWMGMNAPTGWGLEGVVWKAKYTDVK
ncbi:LamG-like jellyroll fold domain-containing protein [Pedobacter gandavensis]|uniref:DUF4983 domain-containing protein n=1 Tax=Pedobacter gandavensis TaxID=2679963 RepID=A0ABR6EXL3_9SPHI|nr:LamG-like jellyroll fold domain-containing protein [Pedobacter gandavensis]MBB2150032.1 DUF4983 domain-containing protein [Pedobacter gandavensis]